MSVRSVLRRKGPEVATVRAQDKVGAAVKMLWEKRIGALVVNDKWGKLAGMFSERDVISGLGRQGAGALDLEVGELMTPDVTTCSPDDRIDDVMQVMTAHRVRHLPVIEGGRLVGIVSIGDLVKQRLDEKEEEAHVLLDIARARL
jgi:CBS domain-containing protein